MIDQINRNSPAEINEKSEGNDNKLTQEGGESPLQPSTESVISTSAQKEQVLEFLDDDKVSVLNIMNNDDESSHLENFTDATLDEFFARPVRIDSSTWTVGSHFDLSLDPWYLYFSQTSVIKKLDNYQWARANLHVKVVINGTPFHYSRLLVSYQPLPSVNTNHAPRDPTGSGRPTSIMKASMLPNTMIDPGSQVPIQVDIPFLNQRNYISTSSLASITNGLGTIRMNSTIPLEVANDSGALAIPVVTYAWASDVELLVPTNRLIAASKSKKKKKKKKKKSRPKGFKNSVKFYGQKAMALLPDPTPGDEEENGLVSSVSSLVADAAGKLSTVPIIGSYASTISNVATGVTKVARFFGFARPPVFTDTSYYKNTPFTSTSLTQGNETVAKLTWDPKAQVSNDPSITMSPEYDELDISTIAQQDALISTVVWSSADLTDSELFWANVTPTYTRQMTVTGATEYIESPLSFAARPFDYWTGEIKYRFQFVGSTFHTGRLRVTFEPDGQAFDGDNTNVTYSAIMDLTKGRDITFVVPWAQNVRFKNVSQSVGNQFFIPPSGIKNYNDNICNGIIYLTVLSPLVSSDASKSASINVFASAGESFEVFSPATLALHDKQDYAVPVAAADTENSLIDDDELEYLFGGPTADATLVNSLSIYSGEKVTSFRSLLKRYNHNQTCVANVLVTGPGWQRVKYFFGTFPNHRGYYPLNGTLTYGSADGGVTSAPYNFNNNPLYTYVTTAFLGQRGSLRYKMIPSTDGNTPTSIRVSRNLGVTLDRENPTTINRIYDTSTANRQNAVINNTESTFHSGTYLQPGVNGQPGVEFELPYYSNLKFSTTSAIIIGGVTTSDPRTTEVNELSVVYRASSDYNYNVSSYVATGEDFTVNMFLGPPYKYSLDNTYAPTD